MLPVLLHPFFAPVQAFAEHIMFRSMLRSRLLAFLKAAASATQVAAVVQLEMPSRLQFFLLTSTLTFLLLYPCETAAHA